MAKTNQNSDPRTEPMDVSGDDALGLIAAWQGIYHVMRGRVDSFDVTDDGIVARNFTMGADLNVTPEQVITDVNRRDRRTQLWPAILWINGQEPAHFANANELTQFGVAYFKGDSESGTTGTQKYYRDAAAVYKNSQNFATRKRGPKPSRINLKELSSLDLSTLTNAGVSPADLDHLIEVAQAAKASQATAAVSTES